MPKLETALAAILAEARAEVAAGREPDVTRVEGRISSAGRRARLAGDASAAVDELEAVARRTLSGIIAVARARALLAREPALALKRVQERRRRLTLRSKPTISGSLAVRRGEGEGYRLVWDAVPTVTEWEVRFSERPDSRSSYVERATVVLAAAETTVEVPLGDNPLRVYVLGRGRGRLQRRALISGLTREGWNERWQRRPSAS